MRIFSPRQSWLLLSSASLLFLISLLITLRDKPISDHVLQGNPLNIAIEVAGEVSHPGFYSFAREITVERALLSAGGVEREKIGNPQVLTQALKAGSKIIVRRNERHVLIVELARMEPGKCLVFSVPLDLNAVEEEHLTLMPGIGPELARRIIEYRSKKGGFRAIEELMEVRGIGQEKLRSLERYLVVEGQ
jgi:competence protein ComEA